MRSHAWLVALGALPLVTVACDNAGVVVRLDGGPARDARTDAAEPPDADAAAPEDAALDAAPDAAPDASAAPDARPMDAGADGGGPAPDAGAAERWSLQDGDTVALAEQGGEGGSPDSAACGFGDLLRGFQGAADTVPIRMTLACSQLGGDGSLGSPLPSREFGGTRAGLPFTDLCDDGEVVIGLHGSTVMGFANFYVNRLGLVCAPLDGWARGAGPRVTRLDPRGDAQDGEVPFDERCPPGYVVDELHGRAGAFIDRVGATCVRVLVIAP